jgi:hypothetical protein
MVMASSVAVRVLDTTNVLYLLLRVNRVLLDFHDVRKYNMCSGSSTSIQGNQMPSSTISGADWLRESGTKVVAVSLNPEEHTAAMHLAAALGVRGRAEVGRILFRWAARISAGGTDPEKLQKILSGAIDSIE